MDTQENTPTPVETTPENTTPPANRKRKRLILIGVAAILLITAVSATVMLTKNSGSGPVSSTKQLEKAPVTIGKYRYVNACQAVPVKSYKQVFGYDISNNVALDNTYAEGTRTKKASLTSQCLTSFGDQTIDLGGGNTTPGDAGSIRITLTQYSDPKLAASDVKPYQGLKGQDVDLTAIGIDDTVTTSNYDAIPVGDVTAYLNTTKGDRFYLAYRNVSAGFVVSDFNDPSAKLKVVSDEYVRQLVPKIVPVIKASIDDSGLSQQPLAIESVGQPLLGGTSAKAVQPCDYFTSDDFKTATGSQDDTTQVRALYDMNPIAEAKQPTANPSGGIGDSQCKRVGYIDAVEPNIQSYPNFKDFGPADSKYKKIEYPVVTATIQYFKTNTDAIKGAKSLQTSHKISYPDTVNTEVSGLGDYAAFSKFTFSSNIVDTGSVDEGDKMDYLYAVKGSYLISIDMYYSSGDTSIIRRGSDAQYKQAAQLLLDRLSR